MLPLLSRVQSHSGPLFSRQLVPRIAFGRSWLFPDRPAIAEPRRTREDLFGHTAALASP